MFEELIFGRYTVDIFVMFFWTLVTQVMLGWVYYPIQTFPAFGGLQLHEIPSVVRVRLLPALYLADRHIRAAQHNVSSERCGFVWIDKQCSLQYIV